jgi:hypothetical protein
VSISTNILTIQVTTRKVVNFFVTIFYEDYTLFKSLPVKVTIKSPCEAENMTPKANPIELKIQINKKASGSNVI